MSRKPPITDESTPLGSLSRRGFMGAVAGASAGAAAAVGGLVLPASAQAEVQFPKERRLWCRRQCGGGRLPLGNRPVRLRGRRQTAEGSGRHVLSRGPRSTVSEAR